MSKPWKDVIGAIIFGALTCSFVLAQQPPSPQFQKEIQHLHSQIQEWEGVTRHWDAQANWQIALFTLISLFGGLIAVLQAANKPWSKVATGVLGVVMAVLTTVSTKVLPDYRVLEQAVIAAGDEIQKLRTVEDGFGQPPTNGDDIKRLYADWINASNEFSGLRKAVASGAGVVKGQSNLGTPVRINIVYAQSQAPAWWQHPPSDNYNLYFKGVAEDSSLEQARQKSIQKAALDGARKLSRDKSDTAAILQMLASSSVVDRSQFQFDATNRVYRYYTLLRISSDIANLRFPPENTISVPGQTKWMNTKISVNRDDFITFAAEGQVSWAPGKWVDPEGSPDKKNPSPLHSHAAYPVPGFGVGGLVAKIGNGKPFAVGKSKQIVAQEAGTLFLGINDNNVKDNDGTFSVAVVVIPSK